MVSSFGQGEHYSALEMFQSVIHSCYLHVQEYQLLVVAIHPNHSLPRLPSTLAP